MKNTTFALWLSVIVATGCENKPGTVVPVIDDPSVGEREIDTVPDMPPQPVGPESAQSPPLSQPAPEHARDASTHE